MSEYFSRISNIIGLTARHNPSVLSTIYTAVAGKLGGRFMRQKAFSTNGPTLHASHVYLIHRDRRWQKGRERNSEMIKIVNKSNRTIFCFVKSAANQQGLNWATAKKEQTNAKGKMRKTKFGDKTHGIKETNMVSRTCYVTLIHFNFSGKPDFCHSKTNLYFLHIFSR